MKVKNEVLDGVGKEVVGRHGCCGVSMIVNLLWWCLFCFCGGRRAEARLATARPLISSYSYYFMAGVAPPKTLLWRESERHIIR